MRTAIWNCKLEYETYRPPFHRGARILRLQLPYYPLTPFADHVESDDDFVTVARVETIAEGRGSTFAVGDRLIAVFLVGGEYFAINDLCPHMGASLAEGEVDNGIVSCPWHFWRFRISDGTWCDNPRIKTDRFDVRVVGDEIQVRVPPNDQA